MKRPGGRFAIIAAVTLGGGAWTFAAAQPGGIVVGGANTSIELEARALQQAKAQAADAKGRSQALDRRAATATQEADKARSRIAALAARIQETEADIRASESRAAIIAKLQRKQAIMLAEKQAPASRLLGALQYAARRPAALTLVEPGSVRNIVRVRAVLASVLPEIDRRTASLRADIARSRALRQSALTVAKTLAANKQKLASQQIQLRALETQRRVAARSLSAGANLEADKALGLAEKARDIGELIDRIETASDVRDRLVTLAGPVLRPAMPGTAGAPAREAQAATTATPPYRLPLLGPVVTGLGEVSESGVRSRGLTISARGGAQVVAPASGRISFAGPYRGFGRIIIIEHGRGWTSLITNLGRLSVGVGDSIQQGDPLGNAPDGRTNVTVELRRNGRPVDIVALIGNG